MKPGGSYKSIPVCCCRLGPSASQVHLENDRMIEFVKAVSFIQNMMKEPWAQQVVGIMGAPPCSTFATGPSVAAPAPATVPAKPSEDKSSDLDNAMNGKPAPARPAKTKSSPTAPPTPATPPTAPPTPVTPAAPAVPNAEPAPEASEPEKTNPPKEINSSTHRAAHARLARKMCSMNEAECPQMQKLWSGSRKDTSSKQIWPTSFCFFIPFYLRYI